MEQLKNLSKSTLDGSINGSQTTLDVASSATFPASGNFRIRIDDEIILVTGVSSDTFTVTRGVEGTSGASHTNGANVIGVLTAGALDSVFDDRLAVPRFTQPPSSWTWKNQGSATQTMQGSTMFLTDPVHSTNNYRWLYRSAPGSTYTITMCARVLFDGHHGSGSPEFGCGFFAPASGKASFIRWRITNGTNTVCTVAYNNNDDTTLASNVNTAYAVAGGGVLPVDKVWFRLVMGGTNREYWFSPDGINWFKSYEETKATNFTPTHCGLIFQNVGTTANSNIGGAMPITLLSWNES